MDDCCNIKKVATVTVYENKNEVKHHGYMAGDRNTPVLEVIFRHFWDIQTLKDCKLRWVLVDDTGSLVVGETSISDDNKASIPLPNELFNGERRMKVQLTVASCDGARILNLQQITDLKVISSLATNEIVEPVYGTLINGIYDETQKCINSIKEYLLEAENGGNAEYLQGYSPNDFEKIEQTVNALTNAAKSKYVVGNVVSVLGFHTKGDGSHHKRKIESADDGSGVQLVNGLWANIVHNGEVNVSWFGAKGDGVTNDTVAIQKALDFNGSKTTIFDYKTYFISKTLIVRRNKNIRGSKATLLAKKDSWISETIGVSIPTKAIVYIEARLPVWESELQQKSTKITDLIVSSDDIEYGFIGMYLGTYDNTEITQSSSVNYSVSGYVFDNISFIKVYTALFLSEVWDCNFNNINSSNVKVGLYIHGQSVNNVFTSCKMYASDKSVYVNSKTYNAIVRRPEGFSFNGGFYGKSAVGIEFVSGLAFYFNGCIIDLNSRHAILGTDMSDVVFNNCYLYSNNTAETVYINNMSTKQNNTCLKLVNSHILNYTGGSIRVGNNQNGIIVDNCQIKGTAKTEINGHFILKDNLFYTGGINNLGSVVSINNTVKTTQLPVEVVGNKNYVLNLDNELSLNNKVLTRNISDANDIDDMYKLSVGNGSSPTNGVGGNGIYKNIRFDANLGFQVCYLANSNVYIRSEVGGVWGAWKIWFNASTLSTLDTPYYTLKMQQEGIYEDYVAYRDELHEYENSQTADETMLLPVLHEPVIPESIKQFAEKYKLI